MSQHNTLIKAVSAAGYEAARTRSAVVDRSNLGRIVISGADRASYLQGLLTNDIVALKAGQGCYSAYLTAQGRMIADMHVYELGDVLLLVMAGAVKDTVLARLDQFIFSEDVQLGDTTEAFAQIAVIGPSAASVVEAIIGTMPADVVSALPENGNLRATWHGASMVVIRTSDLGEPGYDLLIERAKEEALRSALTLAGGVVLDEATADAIRIEGGAPLFHRDMDEETLPLEAGIESRAISFTKGCYVGQEVVIRVLHRGHGRVAKKLVGLVLQGESAPDPGAPVSSGDREIGHITSSAFSPGLKHPIALAYLHRDFLEPGTPVTVGGVTATVTTLPFVRSA